jgi:hypothetical protein
MVATLSTLRRQNDVERESRDAAKRELAIARNDVANLERELDELRRSLESQTFVLQDDQLRRAYDTLRANHMRELEKERSLSSMRKAQIDQNFRTIQQYIREVRELEEALNALTAAWRAEDEESRSHGCADELQEELKRLHARNK